LGILATEHVTNSLGAGGGQEAVVGHPFVVEDLRQIAAAAVRQQDDHDIVGSGPLGRAYGRDCGHPTRATHENALLPGQPAGHGEGVLVGNGDDLVADGSVVGLRPEILADTLDEVGATGATGVDPALGHLLEIVAGTADGATGADPGDEVGDASVGLSPELGTGRLVVRAGVV